MLDRQVMASKAASEVSKTPTKKRKSGGRRGARFVRELPSGCRASTAGWRAAFGEHRRGEKTSCTAATASRRASKV